MRVSLKWIQRLLQREDLGVTPPELVDCLSRKVAEIDDLVRVGGELDGVVVGLVENCQQHPNADRLRCCTVNTGAAEPLAIVCGAPNVATGQKVAVATVGTTLRDAQGQEITIKKGKLRGEPSLGMICAEDELGLGESHDGIMVLADNLPVGTPLAQALGREDWVLEIDNHNINHRPDLWGHIGWAREIAACLDLPFNDPLTTTWQDSGKGMSVVLNSDGCTTYCGAEVSGVRNQSSPAWMREALEAVGSRSRGLLVDLTNYVMLEVGEPMHAFDRRRINGAQLIVRDAGAGEAFTTLDERQHQLQASDMLIADAQQPLALAGIMGGMDSMVAEDTEHIVMEAAIFAPERIRHTRLRLGGGTDSSSRFEKGLPCESAPAALNRALQLLNELIPEAQVRCRFHAGELAQARPAITLKSERVRQLGGLEVSAEQQTQLLARLGISASASGYQPPWWRHKDLNVSEDLVEEVLRLHGYEHLVEEAPRLPVQVPTVLGERAIAPALRASLSAAGWDEVQTYVFTAERWRQALAWPESEVVELVNAPAADQTIMRRSLLPTLLEAVGRNRKYFPRVMIYELGRIYGRGIGDQPLLDERNTLAGAICQSGEDTPFYAARDAALTALASLGHKGELADGDCPTGLIAGRCALLQVDGTTVGVVGECQREVREMVDVEDAVAYFQLDMSTIINELSVPPPIRYVPPSRYQQVSREFTWVCPESLTFAAIAQEMRAAAGNWVRGIDLVTVYRGEPIAADHKALSISIDLASDERTLSDKDLSKIHRSIVKRVEHQTPATLRG